MIKGRFFKSEKSHIEFTVKIASTYPIDPPVIEVNNCSYDKNTLEIFLAHCRDIVVKLNAGLDPNYEKGGSLISFKEKVGINTNQKFEEEVKDFDRSAIKHDVEFLRRQNELKD
jgi:hypothetical protein